MSESAQDAGAPFERFRFDGSDGDELAASRTLVPEPNPTMLRRLAERVAASHYTGYSVDRQKLLAWADEIEAAADRVVPPPQPPDAGLADALRYLLEANNQHHNAPADWQRLDAALEAADAALREYDAVSGQEDA